jgi:GcrA cell cycle regulator
MDSIWTDERVAQLGKLWAEGLSTAEIGRRLGITKNAVVGKAHRLQLAPRPSPLNSPPAPRRPAPTPIVQLDVAGPSCCWPIGHPGDKGFHFCGGRNIPGKPYCTEHAALAYVKPKERGSNAA